LNSDLGALARGSGRVEGLPLLCAGALIAVDASLIAQGDALAGAIADGILVFVLLNLAASHFRGGGSEGPGSAGHAIRALALVALVGVIGAGLPLSEGSEATATLVVALLVGLATLWAAPGLGIPVRTLIRTRSPLIQVYTAAGGLLLGLVLYLQGAPRLWMGDARPSRVVIAVAAAAAAATVEEILYRGIVQTTMQRASGRIGLLGASVVFTATYLDVRPVAVLLTVALAGLLFAYALARSGALTGAIAGHVTLVLSAGGVWPLVFGHERASWLRGSGAVVVLSAAIVATTVTLLRAGQQRPHLGDDDYAWRW
jgi:membrane protease YdiL (CAAX protease family)